MPEMHVATMTRGARSGSADSGLPQERDQATRRPITVNGKVNGSRGSGLSRHGAGGEGVTTAGDAPPPWAPAPPGGRAPGAKTPRARPFVPPAEGRGALLAACRGPNILFNTNAGPPLRVFREWPRQQI